MSTKNGCGTMLTSRSTLGSSIHMSLEKNISWKVIKARSKFAAINSDSATITVITAKQAYLTHLNSTDIFRLYNNI